MRQAHSLHLSASLFFSAALFLQIFTRLTLSYHPFLSCATSSGKPSVVSESKLAPFFQPRHFPLETFSFFPQKTHGTNWSYLASRCSNVSLSVLHPPLDCAQVRIFLTCPLRASVPGATPGIAAWMNEMQAVTWSYACLEMFNKQWKLKINLRWSPVYLPPGRAICSSCLALHEC